MILVLMHSWLSWMDDQEWLGSQESAGSCALASIQTVGNISMCCHTHTHLFSSDCCTYCNNLHLYVSSQISFADGQDSSKNHPTH